ncbi:MAG: hypothetical protein R3F20_03460 [Planctomycetota bacterium]
MRTPLAFTTALLLALNFLPACASSGAGAGSDSRSRGETASAAPAPARRTSTDDLPEPSRLVHDPAEVPAAVRNIEKHIDPKSGLLADEVLIEVSKNYQFDVSLAGDRVGHVLAGTDGTDRMAIGPSIAFVRNLKIKADQRIRLRIADFGTRPFIRITARGRCAHVVEGGSPGSVKRADAILIRNDKISYLDGAQTAAAAAEFVGVGADD